jgi:predicted regulator of Ras-like GTPase activity (Roadblock/LC7/MglB family)
MKMSSAPAPTPATPPPAAARPAPAQPTLFAALGDLCEHWPEALKDEILRSPLARANVPLDGSVILPGLKRGRLVMTWKQMRLLAQPGSAVSPNDNLELELPLKVIAPLFLAAQKNPTRLQSKAAVSSDIPDLFFGFPQPAAAPVAPAAPLLAVVPPLPRPPEPRPQDTNYFVQSEKGEIPQAGEAPQTDFMNRQTHPKEVVARAAALAGVAGAVVAMQDGLRVASQIPAELNPDTLAAFLPQIFERVNQSTRELRMGALNNLNFTVGNVPWKIFRVNAVYFAAFGRSGEQLPSAQLAQLAAELDRKK